MSFYFNDGVHFFEPTSVLERLPRLSPDQQKWVVEEIKSYDLDRQIRLRTTTEYALYRAVTDIEELVRPLDALTKQEKVSNSVEMYWWSYVVGALIDQEPWASIEKLVQRKVILPFGSSDISISTVGPEKCQLLGQSIYREILMRHLRIEANVQ